ncbi:tandem C2 domains nuclear protein isoform X2 [Engraulis encrasicolus]|uniref:tandem C2 domains nuclear protein isoform X2 n=1 Tax=Engraulis encrasicolus TaxID=184585 RepID=UPI002FD18690
MAAECIKDCCRFFQSKEDEPEPEAIPSNQDVIREDIKKSFGVSEDYLLSKLPPDGKEVPFVLPTFKPSYIQPQGARYSNYPTGQQGSARSAYAERKAEILGISTKAYDIDPAAIPASHTVYHISPGSTLEDKSLLTTPAQDLKPTRQRLSASMFDLSGPSPPPSYMQCKDIPVDSAEHKIGIKGIITLDKPVQFKSTLKEAAPDALFMETFVFALPLQQLRNSALVLRLHLHTPRKRTLAECVLSLRQLSPEEAQYSLQLRPPSKSRACHAELHLATCFQPVNARMQLQVRSAQNLPSSSSPLTQSFFIKAELHSQDLLVTKKKTRALKMAGGQVQWSESLLFPLRAHDDSFHLCAKLYSRTSVRRRQFLGQVHLGFSSPSPTAVEQWRDTMANPEKVVADWHTLTAP